MRCGQPPECHANPGRNSSEYPKNKKTGDPYADLLTKIMIETELDDLDYPKNVKKAVAEYVLNGENISFLQQKYKVTSYKIRQCREVFLKKIKNIFQDF